MDDAIRHSIINQLAQLLTVECELKVSFIVTDEDAYAKIIAILRDKKVTFQPPRLPPFFGTLRQVSDGGDVNYWVAIKMGWSGKYHMNRDLIEVARMINSEA